MAKYYYDRYGVNSSTTYTWSKYNTVSTTTYTWDRRYAGENTTYSAGPWVGRFDDKYVTPDYPVSGYTEYTISSSGKFQTTGTYYSGPIGDGPHYLYNKQSDTVMRRYTRGPSSTENFYHSTHESTLESVTTYIRGALLGTVSGKSYDYKLHDQRNPDGYWWERVSSSTTYSRGSYISQTSGRSYNYKLHDQRNSDGYWWVRSSASTSYSRGSYIDTITAEDGTYPTNGRVGTSYWYVRGSKVFPDFKVKADGQLRTSEEGWVKINGVLRPIEQMWVKVNGVIKEV